MHPLRKFREAGNPSPDHAAVFLAENVVMHSPLLTRPIVGRELVAITLSNSTQSRDDLDIFTDPRIERGTRLADG